MARRIFVCYRREDSAGYAGRIYDRLNEHFPDQVFRDVDSIGLITRWGTTIEETLRSCDVAVVLIGSRWLDRGADGARRLDRVDDPVRKEINALLRLEVDLVPTLVAGATVPTRDALPEDVMPITDWQALHIDDDDFDHDTGRLIQALEKRLSDKQPAHDSAPPLQSMTSAPSAAAAPQSQVPGAPPIHWKDGDVDGPFLMQIDDVFTIAGRGAVVTGRIKRGRVRIGDEVVLAGIRATRAVTVTGIESSGKLLEEAHAGNDFGVLIKGVKEDEIERGQVLAKPDSVESRTTFALAAHMLSPEEGGSSQPIVNGERLQFWIHGIEVTGTVALQAGAKELVASEDQSVTVHLSAPMALAKGLLIGIRRDDETIGIGTVLDVERQNATP